MLNDQKYLLCDICINVFFLIVKISAFPFLETCSVEGILPLVRKSCDNRPFCFLYAYTDEDPCPHVSKYLEVVFSCEQNGMSLVFPRVSQGPGGLCYGVC